MCFTSVSSKLDAEMYGAQYCALLFADVDAQQPVALSMLITTETPECTLSFIIL